MGRQKKATSYRLSDAFETNLKELSKLYGLSKTGTLELAVRLCAADEGKVFGNVKIRRYVESQREASTPMDNRPYRLTDEAKARVDKMSSEWNLSHAEVLEYCVASHALGNGLSVGI